MQIERLLVPEATIEAFAQQHELVMVISERAADLRLAIRAPRFTAKFKSAEIKDGPILRGAYGNGETEEEAIADYLPKISEQLLVIDAYGAHRKEIAVPRLVPGEKS